MIQAPVSACIIVKNEPLLEECLKSIRDYVEEIVVVDTGSTDNTFEIAKKYADIFEVYTGCNDPETGLINDFSDARRRSFDLATKKWIIWLDADDLVYGLEHLPTLIAEYEKNPNKLDAIGYLFKYEYSYDANGDCNMEHFRERLISDKTKFHWVNPVHEVLVPNNNLNIGLYPRNEIVYKHRRHLSKKTPEIGRNLRILNKYFESLPNDDAADARQMYYYGLELSNANLLDKAIKYLSKYIEVSGWDDERVMACLKLVEIHHRLNNLKEAIKWGLKAIEIKENWSEGYFAVAKMYYFLAEAEPGPNEFKNYQKCINFINLGFTFPETDTLLFKNPKERNVEMHRYLNMALNKVGRVKDALDSVNAALTHVPEDPALKNNKKLYEVFISKHNISSDLDLLVKYEYLDTNKVSLIKNILEHQSINESNIGDWKIPDNFQIENLPLNLTTNQLESTIVMLWHQYMLTNEGETALEFLKNVPNVVKNSNIIKNATLITQKFLEQYKKKEIIEEEKKEGKLDIVFCAGDGLEIWTPETVKKNGIGGSELMLMEQAKRLAALGHKVRVYNSCGYLSGTYDNVTYYPTDKYNNIECDILIVSRRADLLDDKFNVKAKVKLLWVHDVFALNANNNLLLKADKILALSQWHKQFLMQHHNLNTDHIIVTRNGIDINRFKEKITKNPYKCINSSSPDRSWPVLLEIWEEVYKQVPHAELHLFYGFHNWKTLAQHDQKQMELISYLERKVSSMKNKGVIFHDRVNHETLSKEMLSSSLWLYPTWFSETSCITAMEVQAAGCKMITSSIAALNETAGERATLISGDWTSPEYKEKFINETVKELKNYNNDEREVIKNYAKSNFSLDSLSKDWEHMFYLLIDEQKYNPIIPYQPTRSYS